MSAPDPFEVVATGARVTVEVSEHEASHGVVEGVSKNGRVVTCRLVAGTPFVSTGSRVLTMCVGDPGGLLKFPVEHAGPMPADPDGPVRFNVLHGSIWVQRRKFFRLRFPPVSIFVRRLRDETRPALSAH